MSIGGHQSARAQTVDWASPPFIVEALGPFDLDPCTMINRPWNTAAHHYSIVDDGLKKPWFGRVWLNPPYGRETGTWLARLADHGNGIALIFARTETEMFFEHVWRKADAVFFFEGRLHFHHPDGRRAAANAGAPSVLVAYGETNSDRLQNCGIPGKFIKLAQEGESRE